MYGINFKKALTNTIAAFYAPPLLLPNIWNDGLRFPGKLRYTPDPTTFGKRFDGNLGALFHQWSNYSKQKRKRISPTFLMHLYYQTDNIYFENNFFLLVINGFSIRKESERKLFHSVDPVF